MSKRHYIECILANFTMSHHSEILKRAFYNKMLFFSPQLLHIIKSSYNTSMNKILSTFLTLFCFVFVLILPILLWCHASMMHHHGMSPWDCIEHCMSWETQVYTSAIISSASYLEIWVSKVIFSQIFGYTISLVLLYLVLIYAPPNLSKNIKNYNYSDLIGVIKLLT